MTEPAFPARRTLREVDAELRAVLLEINGGDPLRPYGGFLTSALSRQRQGGDAYDDLVAGARSLLLTALAERGLAEADAVALVDRAEALHREWLDVAEAG